MNCRRNSITKYMCFILLAGMMLTFSLLTSQESLAAIDITKTSNANSEIRTVLVRPLYSYKNYEPTDTQLLELYIERKEADIREKILYINESLDASYQDVTVSISQYVPPFMEPLQQESGIPTVVNIEITHNGSSGLSSLEVQEIAKTVMTMVAGVELENIIISDNLQNKYHIEPIEIIVVIAGD